MSQSSGRRSLQHLVEQLEAGALAIAVRAIEHARRIVPLAELERDVRAAAPAEFRFRVAEQGIADTLAARRGQDEELVDLGREPEVLEAEDVNGKQVAGGPAAAP